MFNIDKKRVYAFNDVLQSLPPLATAPMIRTITTNITMDEVFDERSKEIFQRVINEEETTQEEREYLNEFMEKWNEETEKDFRRQESIITFAISDTLDTDHMFTQARKLAEHGMSEDEIIEYIQNNKNKRERFIFVYKGGGIRYIIYVDYKKLKNTITEIRAAEGTIELIDVRFEQRKNEPIIKEKSKSRRSLCDDDLSEFVWIALIVFSDNILIKLLSLSSLIVFTACRLYAKYYQK